MRTIGEILTAVKEAETDEDKLKVLEDNKNFPHLEYFLTGIASGKEYWKLPESVKYSTRQHVIGRCPSLVSQMTTIRYFEMPTKLREDRLQSLFLGLMDSLHVSETVVLEALFDQTELDGVSNTLIEKVFSVEKSEKPVEKPVEKVIEKTVETEEVVETVEAVTTEEVTEVPVVEAVVTEEEVVVTKPKTRKKRVTKKKED